MEGQQNSFFLFQGHLQGSPHLIPYLEVRAMRGWEGRAVGGCPFTKTLSLSKLYLGSSEPSSPPGHGPGLLCPSLLSPVLARILQSQFKENPSPFISEEIAPILDVLALSLPSARILLGQFGRILPTLGVSLSNFHPLTPPHHLLFGYKFPLVLIILGIELPSILRFLFCYFNSSLLKSVFTT